MFRNWRFMIWAVLMGLFNMLMLFVPNRSIFILSDEVPKSPWPALYPFTCANTRTPFGVVHRST